MQPGCPAVSKNCVRRDGPTQVGDTPPKKLDRSNLWMLEQYGLDICLVALGNSLKLSLLFLLIGERLIGERLIGERLIGERLIGERSVGTERSLGRGDRCSETREFIPILNASILVG
jgi:hypothetical protein